MISSSLKKKASFPKIMDWFIGIFRGGHWRSFVFNLCKLMDLSIVDVVLLIKIIILSDAPVLSPLTSEIIFRSALNPLDTTPCLWCVCVSHSVMSDSLQRRGLEPTRLLYPWNSPGKNIVVCWHSLLQGIFLTQGSHVSCVFAGSFFFFFFLIYF